MFCIECGNKIEEKSNFCNKCGSKSDKPSEKEVVVGNSEQKWWMRLAKVVYILLFLPIIGIVLLVWSENTPYYSTYSKTTYGSYGEAFGYSILALIISIIVVKLIKIGFLYIALGKKPNWKEEITRPY